MRSSKLFLSNSSAQAFLDCRKKFKLQYIDRVKPKQELSNKYLSFGNSMHAALATFNTLTSTKDRTLDNLHNLLRSHWIRDGYESREEERRFGLKGLDMLTNYFNDPQDKGKENLLVEEFIKKDLNASCILCGKLDKVYITVEDQIEVIDYKTGDTVAPLNLMQLYIYVLLCKEYLGTYPQLISLYYLSQCMKITHRVTDAFISESNEVISWLYDEINNEIEFASNPSMHCKTNCSFYLNCDEGQDSNGIVLSKLINPLIINEINDVF